MKKLILILSILACSFAALAQGPNSFGGVALRVNDTTTYQTNAAAFHTAGYYDIYFNNQATNDHWDVWNGSSYDHIFAFNSGGGAGISDGDKGHVVVSGSGTVWNLDAAFLSDVVSVSTASGTITLDMNDQNVRGFFGSASFATPKTLAISNETTAGVFIVQLNVTDVDAVLTMPADWKMIDQNFDGSTWTPPETGEYIFGGKLMNSVWYVNVAGPYN